MTKETNKDSFENSLQKLEEIVRHLERGDLTLDDSLKAFEEGVKFARHCENKLNEAKGKVEMLVKAESGKSTTVPFKAEE